MAVPILITTGEQTVTTTGPVTGVLTTTGLGTFGSYAIRITGLLAGQTIKVQLEDTASATAFSDAIAVWIVDSAAGQIPDGNTWGRLWYEVPSVRFGGANSKLRLNVTAITGGASVKVLGWLNQ